MLRRMFVLFVLAPLGLLIIALAVANRKAITVSFDPFSATTPAFAVTVPLYLLGFILLIAGVILGGVAAWFRQRKWRRAARERDAEARALRAELDGLKRRTGLGTRAGLPVALDQTPQALRPPAA
jgi:uncharacterized integral membrane protein